MFCFKLVFVILLVKDLAPTFSFKSSINSPRSKLVFRLRIIESCLFNPDFFLKFWILLVNSLANPSCSNSFVSLVSNLTFNLPFLILVF